MEKQTLHRAADTITELLQAHVSDSAESIDVHEAIAVRDELRELARDSDEYELPEVGDTLYHHRTPVDVVEVTQYTAELYHIENGDGTAVAEYQTNDSYDPDSPVVKVTYPGGSKEYAMPLDRLTRSP